MIFAAEDLISDDPRPTPLYAATASASRANAWTSVNGWAAAKLFSTIEEEYEAVKNNAAVIDMGAITHYAVRGKESAVMLSRATSAPADSLELGEGARGVILDAEGGVIDLVETTRLADALFLLTTSRPHARRLKLGTRGFEVDVEDITGQIAAIGLIGPDARAAAAAAGLETASGYLAAQGRVRGVETAARPIQIGAVSGVELIFPMEESLTIWERLRRASAPTPIGLDAFEILRIEAGAPRPGVDFTPADAARSKEIIRTPEELGLPHLAPLNRGWFNGRRALKHAAAPARRAVTGLAVDAEHVAAGAAVFAGDAPVGRITSSAFSPQLKRVVAFADIARAALKKPLEVSPAAANQDRAAARLLDTAESGLAAAYLDSLRETTEKRR
ncbi:MAG: glycine cleavage T C-terminal barrel domain-containing protein [Parvularculaceae bacterium]